MKTSSRGRGRPPGRGRKVDPVLPPDAHAAIRLLVQRRRYGTTVNEVARYLILRGLEELTRSHAIPGDPINSTDRDQ